MIESLALKEYARSLGFLHIGISKAQRLDEQAHRLESWLTKQYHADMTYMERYFDQRIDPQMMMPGTKSIITLSFNYFQKPDESTDPNPHIARYAYGKDYHIVLKDKSKQLITWMQLNYGDIAARAFVDSAPVMEREWAQRSGISWNGKNTLSIHPREGSYFFLVCIFVDLDFVVDAPIADHCGTCRRCIDACPTDALHADGYLLDASKCISYLTIENKNEIPSEFTGKMNDWIFGCDICQEVCPWNRFAKQTNEPEFTKNTNLLSLSIDDWKAMDDIHFNAIAKNSPIKRTKLSGMKRNAIFLQKK